MSLRYSFAAVLQLMRLRKGITQPAMTKHVNQQTVSKLELAKSSVSLETSYKLAAGLEIETVTLVALTIASHDRRTAREILLASLAEIEGLDLADVALPAEPERVTPMNISRAREKLEAVQELKAKGLTQVEAARQLGMPESTVRRFWHQALE
ncbi:helix-turn-helix domain-containing protein [Pseudomonas putida]|uniref:helix-turn-helix domain-containing protein n=1 Tax=Pseudomonas putida TaxID=303 RepID=UPI0023637838|nr:helix-turn-helix domain-containing protein [Pseudomonas putida]MDD2037903.1 helix-turn-helix domain-containing protein [Pseudomonas putida]MDD2043636.1 helix-turn-helix domain-containing protein [Pseudomonas putida]